MILCAKFVSVNSVFACLAWLAVHIIEATTSLNPRQFKPASACRKDSARISLVSFLIQKVKTRPWNKVDCVLVLFTTTRVKHAPKNIYLRVIYCTFTARIHKSLIMNGAGEGNRTLVSGLGSPRSTIEPHPPTFLRGKDRDHPPVL